METFDLLPGTTIARRQPPSDWWGLEWHISEEERHQISDCLYWLTFSWESGETISAGENVNLVLLALWLVKSSETHVSFRFEIGDGDDGPWTAVRLLDRFQWVRGTVDNEFNMHELQQAAAYYAELKAVLSARGRLSNALYLTLCGCFAYQWQVAFTNYAAAAETMLTYSTRPGITRRLATAYACLIETSTPNRDAAFREFLYLYNIRSDIMHGRIHNVAKNDRLASLARFIDVLRALWRTILTTPALIIALEGQDPQRQTYVNTAESGYSPPST